MRTSVFTTVIQQQTRCTDVAFKPVGARIPPRVLIKAGMPHMCCQSVCKSKTRGAPAGSEVARSRPKWPKNQTKLTEWIRIYAQSEAHPEIYIIFSKSSSTVVPKLPKPTLMFVGECTDFLSCSIAVATLRLITCRTLYQYQPTSWGSCHAMHTVFCAK